MTSNDTHLTPDLSGMQIVATRPPLGEYLREAWQRRQFAITLAGYRLIADLLPNRLGILWIVLKPLSMALIYGTIFHFVLSGPARPQDFVQYLLVGVFVFEFYSGSIGSGARAITSNTRLVQSLGFPRILLPISIIIEQAMRMVPVILMLIGLLLILGEPISWSWSMIVPVLAVMAVFNLGLSLVAARLSVLTRDVQQFIPIVTRVLFYISGVFFNVDGALAHHEVLLTAVHLIPTYDFLAIARDVLLEGYAAPPVAWISAFAWTIIMIIGGTLFFWQDEARYGLSD